MRTTTMLLGAALMMVAIPSALWAEETLIVDHHTVTVIDGDTIQVGERVIQLSDIDAPELGQACDDAGHYWLCGLSAAYELRRLIGFQTLPIECSVATAASDPPSAVCMAGEEDLGMILIASGLAVATPGSPPYYKAAERNARDASVGIWGGPFVLPVDWREGMHLPGEHPFGPNGHLHGDLPWKMEDGTLAYEPRSEHAACLVKGIVEEGERVFYGPLDPDYPNVQVDPANGDRWFCGDDLARAAGWRHKGAASRVN